jgi:hypothetical protein
MSSEYEPRKVKSESDLKFLRILLVLNIVVC